MYSMKKLLDFCYIWVLFQSSVQNVFRQPNGPITNMMDTDMFTKLWCPGLEKKINFTLCTYLEVLCESSHTLLYQQVYVFFNSYNFSLSLIFSDPNIKRSCLIKMTSGEYSFFDSGSFSRYDYVVLTQYTYLYIRIKNTNWLH